LRHFLFHSISYLPAFLGHCFLKRLKSYWLRVTLHFAYNAYVCYILWLCDPSKFPLRRP
jgi:hypothetical protein